MLARVVAAREKRGALLVPSDAQVFMGPSFNQLPPERESEVRWLVDRPPPRTVGGAILRVQGLSDESRTAGASFLAGHRPFPAGRLLAAIEATAAWMRLRVDRWLQGESPAIDWADPGAGPDVRGRTLATLVGACGEHGSPAFLTEGRKRAPEILALQRDLVARLPARLPADGDRDGFAVGMLRAGLDLVRECAGDAARAAWEAGRRVARREALVARRDEALAGNR